MTEIDPRTYYYRFSGHERVLHNARADEALPEMLELFSYRRAFVVCSKTLRTKTSAVNRIVASLGPKLVGLTDEVGEHSPLSNVIKAARQARDAAADVIVSIGGGSVMDMCKAMQLCISEGAYDRESLLRLQFVMSSDGTEMLTTSKAPPAIRQIAIPTTLATSEWTPVSTPLDEQTHSKARFVVPCGAPQGVIYDPDLLALSPVKLLLSTGVRGLDHAINTACSSSPHPFAGLLAEKAIQLYMENLPRLQRGPDREALSRCQLATWYTGMGQMSVPHGFSHWMVHVVGPRGGVPHSDAACVLMLAQAKWLEGWAREPHDRIRALLGRDEPFHEILEAFLGKLGMPASMEDLGLSREQVDDMIGPALQHPQVTLNNLRPIRNLEELQSVLELTWRAEA